MAIMNNKERKARDRGRKQGYVKAIDDFEKSLKESLTNNYRHLLSIDTDGFEWLTTEAVETHIENVAEHLKAGVKDE